MSIYFYSMYLDQEIFSKLDSTHVYIFHLEDHLLVNILNFDLLCIKFDCFLTIYKPFHVLYSIV